MLLQLFRMELLFFFEHPRLPQAVKRSIFTYGQIAVYGHDIAHY